MPILVNLECQVKKNIELKMYKKMDEKSDVTYSTKEQKKITISQISDDEKWWYGYLKNNSNKFGWMKPNELIILKNEAQAGKDPEVDLDEREYTEVTYLCKVKDKTTVTIRTRASNTSKKSEKVTTVDPAKNKDVRIMITKIHFKNEKWWYGYVEGKPKYTGWMLCDNLEIVDDTSTKKVKSVDKEQVLKAAKAANEKQEKERQKVLSVTQQERLYLAYLNGVTINDIQVEDGKVLEISNASVKVGNKDKTVVNGIRVSGGTIDYSGDINAGTSYSYKSGVDTGKLFTTNLNGIYGLPYQFPKHVDRKIDGTVFGRTYADKIVAKMPLLLISPGKPEFMSRYKEKDKNNIIKAILGMGEGTDISKVVGEAGRYFTFDFDYKNYYKYVNGMLRANSRFLGINNVKIDIGGTEKALGSFNWSKAVNTNFSNYFGGGPETIAFYVDSATTIDETFSNNTTESQLANKINSFADIGREIQFLLGNTVGKPPEWMDASDMDTVLEEVESLCNEYLDGNKLLTDVAKNFATVATGGKLLFPQIWSDSEFSRSYDINLKLRTPDGDKLSWYMNICVPLCHLIALSAPKQVGYNGYASPFLVRAFYKGLFNCDCGIITSLNISKGKEGAWTIDGLPTEVDVNIQIKDLYQAMAITAGDKTGWFMNNNALMDYLACMCGININKVDIERTLDTYFMLRTNKYTDIPNNIWLTAQNSISNKIKNMYDKGISLLP